MVYLIHFERRFGHALHYIGYCSEGNLINRFNHHLHGNGSKLMAAVTKAGIKCLVVRTWSNADRDFERKLKKSKGSKHLCPICISKLSWESIHFINVTPAERLQNPNVNTTQLSDIAYGAERM